MTTTYVDNKYYINGIEENGCKIYNGNIKKNYIYL